MKARRCMQIVWAVLVAMALPLTALAQTDDVMIEPGLYDYTESSSMAGLPQSSDKFQYCIADDKTSLSLMGLLAPNNLDLNCSLANVNMTSGAGSADVTCRIEEIDLEVMSKLEATYTKTSYNAKMTTLFPNMPTAISELAATRVGDCPADWVNPHASPDSADEE